MDTLSIIGDNTIWGEVDTFSSLLFIMLSMNIERIMSTDKIYNGSIIYFNELKNFGFIRPREKIPEFGGETIFFHRADMQSNTQGYVKVGSEVSFTLGKDVIGRVKAVNVYLFQPSVEPYNIPKGE